MHKSEKIVDRISHILDMQEVKGKNLKVGDIVLLFGKKVKFRITKVTKGQDGFDFISATRADGKGGAGSELQFASEFDVYKEGSKSVPVDKNGKTASFAAKTLNGKFVVFGGSVETFGKVKNVSSSGILTVDHFIRGVVPNPSKKFDQETFRADTLGKPDEVVKLTPALFGGVWKWRSKKDRLNLKGLLGKDGKLTQLLD